MTVQRIPGEDRFFVESQSGREPHVVDLQYKENPWSKSRAACGCESNLIHDRTCPHIVRTVQQECDRLGFLVLANAKGIMITK